MNWFIYIGGGIFGWLILIQFSPRKNHQLDIVITFAWLMVWIWLCWRFI